MVSQNLYSKNLVRKIGYNIHSLKTTTQHKNILKFTWHPSTVFVAIESRATWLLSGSHRHNIL